MMSLAGASRAVVPALPEFLVPAGSPAALAAGAGTAATPPAVPDTAPDAAELDALLAEHPARNKPPPSMTAPRARPAMPSGGRLILADRRLEPRVFSMPV